MVEVNFDELQSALGFYPGPQPPHAAVLLKGNYSPHRYWQIIRPRACSDPWIPATRLRGYRHRGHDAIHSAVIAATAVIFAKA